MKVYWTTSLSYDKKEEMVKFCEDNSLTYEWQKAPKEHYVIIDILDSDNTAQKVFDLVGEEVRTTQRDNKVKALQKLKNAMYGITKKEYESMPSDPMERFTDVIEEVQSNFHVELSREEVLYAASNAVYSYENMIQGWGKDSRCLIDKITSELCRIEREETK